MAITLEGRTAIVTSMAHDAGRAIAERFLEAGANVMLAHALDLDADDALAAEDPKIGRFSYVAQDKLCIANLLAATADRFDRVDILVNGALDPVAMGTFMDMGTGDFDAAVGTNVSAVFQLSQAVAKRMIHQAQDGSTPRGCIVNVSSIAARRTVPELLAYSVSCAALDQLTRSMATSLAPEGIRVNAVALGGVMTERLRGAFREDEDLREEMIKVTPMGRLAETEEAAEAAQFLASEHASYITGQIISVDGGRTLLDPLASPVRS